MSRLLDYMTTTTWALHPTVLQRLSDVIERHASEIKLDSAAIAAITANRAQSGVGRDGETDYTIDRGVAVIPITGVLQRHASMVNDISGPSGTSYESVRSAVKEAMDDDKVASILLHIDSPGGVVDGVEDLSSELFEARQRKPIFALADGMMASAALWLGAQAERVYATRGTSVGSVGIFASYVDRHRRDEAAGIDLRYLSSADKKNNMLTDQKLTTSQARSVLDQIDAEHALFVEALARGRQTSAEAADAWGDGQMHLATKAQALGLIDEVASYETVINAISETVGDASMAAKTKKTVAEAAADARSRVAGKTTVTVETDAPVTDAESEEEETDEEEEEEEAKAKPKAKDSEASMRARIIAEERNRSKAIRNLAMGGDDELVAALIDEGVSVADAAVELIAFAKKSKGSRLAAIREVAEEETVTVARKDGKLTEAWQRKAEAKWAADAELREEFLNDKATYLSFEEARATGFVKEARR